MTDEMRLIEGVKVNEPPIFDDERGAVARMMRNDDFYFATFGEIYFSIIKPKVVKAWHLHSSMTLNYACIFGKLYLVLYDARTDSPTKGVINEFEIDGLPDFLNYQLVTIPPGVWNGFRSNWHGSCIVANCATEPHRPGEITRVHPDKFELEYDWGKYEVAG